MSSYRLGALLGALLFVSSPASGQVTLYGTACSGPSGSAPQISHSGSFTPGVAAQLHLSGAPPGALVVLMVGTSNTQLPDGTPLPMDLSLFSSFPLGCLLFNSAQIRLPLVTDAQGEVHLGYQNPLGLGPDLYFQWAVTDLPDPLTVVLSQGLHLHLQAGVTPVPAQLDFGTALAGVGLTQTLTLLNETDKPVTVNDAVVYDVDAVDFTPSFPGGPPPVQVPPGGSMSVQVAFDPQGMGPRSASLVLLQAGQPAGFSDPVVALRGVGLGPSGSELLLNVGGPPYFDSQARLWAPDFGSTGGQAGSTVDRILGTQDDELYQAFREGASFHYGFDLPPSPYQLTLHFADPDHGLPGQRVFDVLLEGNVVLSGLDLAAVAGEDTAHTELVTVLVTDGTLDLDLVASTGQALLAGIELISIQPVLQADPAALDFGFVSMGDVLTLPLTLTNTGTDTLQLTSVGFLQGPGQGNGADFILNLGGTPYSGGTGDVILPAALTLTPGQATPASLAFSPSEHRDNDLLLRLEGNFDPLDIPLAGFGGTTQHPFLHAVIEPLAGAVDFDLDGVETVVLDGSASHTHEPGSSLVDYVWTDNGTTLGSGPILTVPLSVGTHAICLTIGDDHLPQETASACLDLGIDPPWAVPGVLAWYYPGGGAPEALLDALPAQPTFAEVRTGLSVEDEGAVGGSPFAGDVLVRLLASVPVPATDTYLLSATGGTDQRLFVDGIPVSGPLALAAGPHDVEARFAVDTLGQLPLQVWMGIQGGPLAPVDPAGLTHDQVNVPPVLNAMPASGSTAGGVQLVLSGLGFFPPGQVTLHWGNSSYGPADFSALDPSAITFVTPPHAAGSVAVTVQTPQGTSNARSYQYQQVNTPIAFTPAAFVGIYQPTTGDWGPDGRFYVASRWGTLHAITFDEDYNVVSTQAYLGTSGTAHNEILGLAFHPYEAADPVRVYVSHMKLYAQGGGPFAGAAPYPGRVSVLQGPDFDDPIPVITGLPVSNHDHGVNGLQFDNNGDLFIAVGGQTNAGVPSNASGTLPESPLSGAILKAELSRPDFNGTITYVETDTGLPNDDQVFGKQVDVAPGSHVRVHAPGLRNAYDLVFTTSGQLYAADNGPNTGFGVISTGPDTQGGEPSQPDEIVHVEYGNYYGHPNRSRGRYDPRQNIYYGPGDPAIPGVYTPEMSVVSASTNGICEYRATTFNSQLRGNLIGQRWNSVLKRFVLTPDGRAVAAWNDMDALVALDVQTGPGGALLGVDYSGSAVKVLVPDDVSAVGLMAHDIHPWRAPSGGGMPIVIGGLGFGTLGDTSVTIGGLPATLTSVTPKRIRGVVPTQPIPGTELLTVAVTVGAETSLMTAAFRYLFPTPGQEPGRWEGLSDLPVALGEVAAGVLDGVLYVVGEGSTQTLAYTVADQTWSTTPPARPFRGHHHAAEVLDGRLYLIGGLMNGSDGRVQIFDPATGAWSLGADMPWPGGSLATAVIDGKIYAAGGIVVDHTVADCAVYDPQADAWTSLAPMPVGRNHTAAATDGQRLFVIGGRSGGNVVGNGFDDLQVYDPATNTWFWDKDGGSQLVPLPVARGGMGQAVFYRGELYVFGGETLSGPGATPDGVYDRVDVYDPVANAWRLEAPMLVPRHGIFPVLYESRMFLPGGGVAAANSQSTALDCFTRQ